jgi:hypothetical protein
MESAYFQSQHQQQPAPLNQPYYGGTGPSNNYPGAIAEVDENSISGASDSGFNPNYKPSFGMQPFSNSKNPYGN